MFIYLNNHGVHACLCLYILIITVCMPVYVSNRKFWGKMASMKCVEKYNDMSAEGASQKFGICLLITATSYEI